MHNYIWCPYYLPSFMKFCSVVSEELHWQAASVVNFGKFLSSKGHNSNKIQEIKISWQYAQLHMVSLLPTKFHEILFSSFRGVALTNRVTDRWTDRTKTMSPHQSGGRHNVNNYMYEEQSISKSYTTGIHSKQKYDMGLWIYRYGDFTHYFSVTVIYIRYKKKQHISSNLSCKRLSDLFDLSNL
jgi:hypothetical protein